MKTINKIIIITILLITNNISLAQNNITNNIIREIININKDITALDLEILLKSFDYKEKGLDIVLSDLDKEILIKSFRYKEK